MAIKLVDDLGAPAAVVLVDLTTEATVPEWNEWAAYLMAAGGYLGAWMGWGGTFMKNVGIASFPWAAKKIYERVKGGTVAGSPRRLAFKKSVARYPAAPFEPQFAGTKLT